MSIFGVKKLNSSKFKVFADDACICSCSHGKILFSRIENIVGNEEMSVTTNVLKRPSLGVVKSQDRVIRSKQKKKKNETFTVIVGHVYAHLSFYSWLYKIRIRKASKVIFHCN